MNFMLRSLDEWSKNLLNRGEFFHNSLKLSCCGSLLLFEIAFQQTTFVRKQGYYSSCTVHESFCIQTILQNICGRLQPVIENCIQIDLSPSAIDIESIKPLSVLHSGIKCEWQPILTPKNTKKNRFFLQKLYYATFQCGRYNI